VLTVNQVLIPTLQPAPLPGPNRVLAINGSVGTVWCIALPQTLAGVMSSTYVAGPRAFALDAIEHAISRDELRVTHVPLPAHLLMRDCDYLEAAQGEEEKTRRENRIKRRDFVWSLIEPIVKLVDVEGLGEVSLRPHVLKQAVLHRTSIPTVYRALHLYWALGSTLNALLPRTDRCGAKGTHRSHYVRKEIHHETDCATAVPPSVFSLTQLDKERLARGFALISPKMSVNDAYLLTCDAFWSRPVANESGVIVPDPLPDGERPTIKQFRYWGPRLGGIRAQEKRLGVRHRTPPTHHGGAARDLASAVGQVAMFDGTSTDVYLTSMRSRLIKLPPMTRSLVMEVKSTLCLGLYCGWESPSPMTGLRAIYCAATNKVELCARFGIEIGDDDWPGALCRTYLADNGELKAESVTEAERQIGFGIEYARSYSGASKGIVESQHHTNHRRFDHCLPGTTHGKQRRRGEPHPADSALWNYGEYMHALLRWIIDYNREEVEEHLAPTAMLKAGLRPTRINIFKWLRDHGQRADIASDLGQLRALTLPEWPAVFHYNGIVLKSADGSRNLEGLRFFCEELRDDPRFARANQERITVPAFVRFEPEHIAQLWLPSSRGLICVPNVESDREAKNSDTVADMEHRYVLDAPNRHKVAVEQDKQRLERLLLNDAISTNASREARAELQTGEKKVSKTSQRKNLRKNVAEEQELVRQLPRDPSSEPFPASAATGAEVPVAVDAADEAVAKLWETC